MKSHDEIMVPQPHHRDGTVRWQLMCPTCGTDNVEDHGGVTVQPDRDQYDSPIDTRGGYASVNLECANGHTFTFVVGNHKGAEMVGVVSQN